MPISITMPALSPTMEEGNLAKWMVKPGDKISSGDVIAEIETDKATMEVEAVDEGVVAKILVPEGTEGVLVNAVIAVLAEDGEDPDSVEAPAAAAAAPAPAAAPEPTPEPAPAPAAAAPEPAAPAPQPAAQVAPAPKPAANGAARVKASPLARRIAKLEGIDLSAVIGTGPGGRIVKRDLANVPKGAPAGSNVPAVIPAQADGLVLPATLDDRVYAPDSYELKPLDGMRKTVARRLTESFMQIPHFPLSMEFQIDKLLSSRKAINEAAPEGVKVSVNDMIIKASAMALMAEPECNASFTDAGIAYHKSANISIAVAIEGGLITPVIRDAQTKGLREISAEMKDLAARARDRKLKPQEYMGGTFSISNLGMFGVKSFGSILNPPEGMIMSVGAGEKKPVVDANGDLTVATMMEVTLTCDHRVIGGAEGARWLQAFKRHIETPETMLL